MRRIVAQEKNKKHLKKKKTVTEEKIENKQPIQIKKTHKKSNKPERNIPKWEFEVSLKGSDLPETKADLLSILAEIDPQELLMDPLVQKHKNISKIYPNNSNDQAANKIIIDISQTCPICNKTIREIMYALHDYDHNQLAHFDCVFKKVSISVKDKLINGRYLAYLGSGSFGIMEPKNNKHSKAILIEKIYPGAPVEELLHGGAEVHGDEEI